MKKGKSSFLLFLLALLFIPAITWGQLATDTTQAKVQLIRADSLINSGEVLLAVANIEASLNLYKKHAAVCQKEIAQCYYLLGEYYYRGRRLTEAVAPLDTAKILYEAMYGANHPHVGKCLQALGLVYLRQDKFAEAERLLNRALETYEGKQGVADKYRSGGIHGLAILYSRTGRYEESIEKYNFEIELIRRGDNPDTSGIAIIHNNIGNIRRRQGYFTGALAAYEKALEIQENLFPPDHISLALPYHNIGNTYLDLSKFNLAIQYLNKSIEIRNAQSGPPSPDIAVTYSMLGFSYRNQGDIASAILCFEKSLEVNQKYRDPDDIYLAQSLIDISMLYANLGRREEALDRVEAGRSIISAYLENNTVSSKVAVLFDQLGYIGYSVNDNEQAIIDWQKALRFWQSLPDASPKDLSNALGNLGAGYMKNGQFDAAIDLLEQCIKINTLSPEQPKVYRPGSLLIVFSASLNLGRSRLALFKQTQSIMQLQRARTIIAEAAQLLEDKARFSQEYSVAYLASSAHESLSLLTEINYALYEATDGMDYLYEIVRLTDLANSFFFLRTKNTYADLAQAKQKHPALDLENELTKRLTDLDIDRAKARKEGLSTLDPSITRIDNLYFQTKDSLLQLRATILADFPSFQTQDLPEEITFPALAACLQGADVSLLSYLLTDSSLFVLHISEDTFSVRRIARDFELSGLLKNFRFGLLGDHIPLDEGTVQDHQEKYIQSATGLYQRLVAPVAAELGRKLIIVPDPQFGNLPFELLLSGPVEKTYDYSTYPYLLKDYQISYAVSINSYCQPPRARPGESVKSMLAVAPFSEKKFLSETSSIPDQEILRGTGENARVIAEMWGGDVLVDAEATETAFVTAADRYRILHIASHGLVDYGFGDLSCLLFSSIPDSIENETLYTKEIYNLSLNAELVTLSGCETNLGRFQWGEGVISLNRAFLLAGAQSVVASLWQVRNDSANELMRIFYERLAAGEDKAEALYNAKLTYLERRRGFRSHPFFWGAFVLNGSRNPISDW